MPKRQDIKSILVIGAGPIVIGQACEFDYSGTQACKALKEEGYKIILINSNPATIMTDPEVADVTYIEPITPEFIEKIIEKERPDAVLPTVGGQTALNCTISLAKAGVFEKYNVELIGASITAIEKAENRQLFKEAMNRISLECPKNVVVHSLEEALKELHYVGLPAIIRPSFTLGGAGGGIAYTTEDYINIVKSGLDASPNREILIDQSIMGWKEFEMEVVRDKADNCIIICSIENIDPMGVHTGDSITVAPALTLTDKEYQNMRNASIAVLREIGVNTGGSNVQFAINPENGKMLVIEMNPRVSRSSALASKATGFPIAKIAAKLAVGYTLDELVNDCTKVTPASFEPTIDYIVTKIPRFTFEKFSQTKRELSSSMKSVGEVMAIGRNFAESLQKALRSLETGLNGLNSIVKDLSDRDGIIEKLKTFTPDRLLLVADAIRAGIALEVIHQVTSYDPWFIEQIASIVIKEQELQIKGLSKDKFTMLELKKLGFADSRIAELTKHSENEIRELRKHFGVSPVYKRIDTCAAEFDSNTAYMYSCYEGDGINQPSCEANISAKTKVIILGSGPNRIGQGIEFDYACVHAAYALKDAGFETLIINCNPETVSTDYDTSDRLYFEALTTENVLDIIDLELQQGKLLGVNLQFGGQTPLKLAKVLAANNVPIIGTDPKNIDLAEDRESFQKLLQKLSILQPKNFICHNKEDLISKAGQIGFPVVVRPSYVLGGRAMSIIDNIIDLEDYLTQNGELFATGPLLIDNFLKHAIEVDVDLIADQTGKIYIAGIMEHIEEAGIHSGDSSCVLPPYSISKENIEKIIENSKALAKELAVVGLMNVQYAIKDDKIYVLEVNPRASRTIPFIAKVTGVPVAKVAALVMAGASLKDLGIVNDCYLIPGNHVAVKQSVFPFNRFSDVDVVLGPEMKSTGEAMGIDLDLERAFAKGHIGAGETIPFKGNVFISVIDEDKAKAAALAKQLITLGFTIYATSGTSKYFAAQNIENLYIAKVSESEHNIVEMIKSNKIHLVINTSRGKKAKTDGFLIRRNALLHKVPHCVTISDSVALVNSIAKLKELNNTYEVRSLQSYIKIN
ncbi:carbamoyl-phosphate synthase large subunit [Rickettsiales endosymbiont of Stachyamoeba lipophora]|uniref:carbamoyl-phosphate synthase large subunit n=1 Tax=Rickettsiales endosymbiont of Stachyamoeba lipophora TaxID=2486578 RepID=UPI000F65041B|nr:carbamoyl-phosphate synthase large subunit [Rickettsiales endosymbiont of Stachyamoeba lipophora]AZL16284.1 carbamoyl-phosphate synthase large subunit [Rickettsiales endosymbiont of Stachyamoeba lipophora]